MEEEEVLRRLNRRGAAVEAGRPLDAVVANLPPRERAVVLEAYQRPDYRWGNAALVAVSAYLARGAQRRRSRAGQTSIPTSVKCQNF